MMQTWVFSVKVESVVEITGYGDTKVEARKIALDTIRKTHPFADLRVLTVDEVK